jgi:immune inhibitor A
MLNAFCRITMIFIITNVYVLLIGSNEADATMPPHQRVLDLIKGRQIPVPYFIQNQNQLVQRGVNAPWSSQQSELRKTLPNNYQERSVGPTKTPTGPWKALAILVKFSDKPQNVITTYFDNLLFGTATGTVRDYYRKVSYGALDIITVNLPSATGWLTAPQTYAYYVDGKNGFGTYPRNAQKLVEDVIDAADASIDFSQYDNDHDGSVDALYIIHSGSGAEFTGSNNDIWSHAGGTSKPLTRDGVTILQYSMEPEYWLAPGDMTCGVFAHELGHAAFGLPDLYDTDYSSTGLGEWSLMAGGSWNGAGSLGGSPAFPDAWSHVQMGYVVPTNITADMVNVPIANMQNTSQVYRIWKNGMAGLQYFLIQNRQQTGYDTYLPGNGLTIYHIDETVQNGNTQEWYPGNTSAGHYLVALEQADGIFDLEHGLNRGNAGDAYPGSTNNRLFTNVTVPGSLDYTGVDTKVRVNNISNSGNVMTADFSIDLGITTPSIVVRPDTVKFGAFYIGFSKTDTLFIENIGGQPLVISSIASNLSVFTPAISSITVPVGTVCPVVLTFSPTDSMAYKGVLTIASNDMAKPSVRVPVTGFGVYAPVITVIPDSFAVALAQYDSTTRTMTIGNAGRGPLTWSVNGGMSASYTFDNPSRDRSNDVVTTPTDPTEMNLTPSRASVSLSASVGNFWEGFESGNFNAWDTVADGAIKEVTSSTAAEGIYSFHYKSAVMGQGGVFRDFMPNYCPNYVGFNVRTGSNLLASGYFRLDGNTSELSVIWFFAGHSGRFYVNADVGGDMTYACNANQWYHVEFRNIDWVNKNFDYYVDNRLIKADIPFRNAASASQFGRLFLYNYEVSEAWWDGISMGMPLNSFTLTPSSGTVAPGSAQNVTAKFNAKNLQEGEYRFGIAITNNDSLRNPKSVPIQITVTSVIRPAIVAKIKVFLQGPYQNDGTMATTLARNHLLPTTQPYTDAQFNYLGTETVTDGAFFITNNVVDWIMVELRSSATGPVVDRRAALLRSDGMVIDTDGMLGVGFNNVSAGSYFLVIRHRNHLALMSAASVSLSGTTALYDFTTGQDRVYGTKPMVVLSTGVYGMYAGDANKSGFITAADINDAISNLNLNAYRSADANLTGYTTASDINIMIANLNKNTKVPN